MGAAIEEAREIIARESEATRAECQVELEGVLSRHGCGIVCRLSLSADGRVQAEPIVVKVESPNGGGRIAGV